MNLFLVKNMSYKVFILYDRFLTIQFFFNFFLTLYFTFITGISVYLQYN